MDYPTFANSQIHSQFCVLQQFRFASGKQPNTLTGLSLTGEWSNKPLLCAQGDHIKTWRRRWFVLKQGYMFRFATPDVSPSTKPRGLVDLSKACRIYTISY